MSENQTAATGGSNPKLERFKESVINDATQLRDRILNEIEEQKKQALAKADLEITKEVQAYLDEQTEKLASKYKQIISKENFEGKKSLLLKREQIIDSVFLEVKGRLSEFTKSDEYKALIIEKTKQARAQLGDCSAIIYARQADLASAQEIKGAWGNPCDVIVSNTIECGGLMFSSNQTQFIIDETFDSKLAALQSDFVKTSGLYFG